MSTELDLRRNRLLSGAGLPISVHVEVCPHISDGAVFTLSLCDNEVVFQKMDEVDGDESYVEYRISEVGHYQANSVRGEGMAQKTLFKVNSVGKITFIADIHAVRESLQAEANGKMDGEYGLGPLYGAPDVCRIASGQRLVIYQSLATEKDETPQNQTLRKILSLPIDASWWLERRGVSPGDLLLEIALESEEAYSLLMSLGSPT